MFDHAPPGYVCPFCLLVEGAFGDARLQTREADVVLRSADAIAIVSPHWWPNNPGHVLVCPYRHVPLYVDLTEDETAEFTALTKAAVRALEAASAPMGFNLGMNQGAVAGAGVAAHLHQHVVPRWGGDTNFMPVVGGTKVMPALLHQTRDLLREHWPS